MSVLKDAVMQKEDELKGIEALLFAAGALRYCEVHNYPVDLDNSQAVSEVTKALELEVGFRESRQLVSAVMIEAHSDCLRCYEIAFGS